MSPRSCLLFALLVAASLCACGTRNERYDADGGISPGDESAYVMFNVPPDEDCTVGRNATEFLTRGTYDISNKTAARAGACNHSYYMHLRVIAAIEDDEDDPNSAIDRPWPFIDRGARVRLTTLAGKTLALGAERTNPFELAAQSFINVSDANGEPVVVIAPVEAIPSAYAEVMHAFVGTTILANIELHAVGRDGKRIEVRPFAFPIELCEGCLTRCGSELTATMTTPEDVYGDQCADNTSADGRVCIDPGC